MIRFAVTYDPTSLLANLLIVLPQFLVVGLELGGFIQDAEPGMSLDLQAGYTCACWCR
jgi:hypothetical protein